MSQPYAKSESYRATLTKEARVVVGPLSPADNRPAGSYRRVQIMVPSSPAVFCGIDMPVQGDFDHPGVGPNRTYVLPQLQPGQRTTVRLLDDQFLTMSCADGLGFCSIFCEYLVSE